MAKRSPLPFEEAIFDEGFYKELDYVVVPTSRKAFFLVLTIALLVVGVAVLKTGFFIFARGTAYAERAEANVSREIRLPTHRAAITDRFGEVLAEHTSSFTVFLNIPTLIAGPGASERVLYALANILKIDHAGLRELVGRADLNQDNWIPIARNITTTEAIAIRSLHEQSLEVLDDSRRVYPNSGAFAAVTGYTGVGERNQIVGISGVESVYNNEIRGQDGRYVLYQDAAGTVVGKRAVQEPQPADAFHLTIDAGLQKYFYERLTTALRSLGRQIGVGLAIDPRDGEILSLINIPSFDANVFIDRSASSERTRLLTDTLKPLFNRAVSGMYSPGSTIKPLVALAALKARVVDTSSKIFSDGVLEIPNQYDPLHPGRFPDWRPNGWVDIRSALAKSSNIYFGVVGGGLPPGSISDSLLQGHLTPGGLGIDALRNAWSYFGLGKKTGVDLPAEAAGLLPSAAERQAQGGNVAPGRHVQRFDWPRRFTPYAIAARLVYSLGW